MAADRLPSEVREFAHYLDGLLARLDPSGGWCAVFWQRDPEGMRACLDGREVPPWDVVEALLQDLAGQYGPGGAGPETERARALHAAALAAYDARPGGRDALGDRLDVMLREQKYAAERQTELTRLLATAATREEADAFRLDFAWAHDDHRRATARCAELRARMADLDRREGVSREVWGDGRVGGTSGAPAGVSSGTDATSGGPDDDGVWPGAWRHRPNDGGVGAADGVSRAGSGGWVGSGAAAEGASGAGSGRGAGPAAGASRAGSARWADSGAAADGGRPVRADGYTPDGPAPDSGRMRSAPGGPYDSGTPATPWHRDAPAPGATGAAGHDDPRHTDTGAAPAGRPGAQDGEFQAGRAAFREAGSGGASGASAAPPGRADAREGGEFAAGRAAFREAGSGGASGASAAPAGRPGAQDGEFQAGHAGFREAGSGGASGASAAPPGRADAREGGEFAAGRAASREAGSDGAWGAFAAPVRGGGGRDGEYPGDGAGTPDPLTPKQRKRRRGSARFAGMVEEDAAPVVVPPAAVPLLPEPAPVTGRRKPRGARFAGAADEEVGEERTEPRAAAVGVAERRDVVQAVEALARLRKEGRSGEAHALLVEAASWAPARFPLLAQELERAGLGADWQTLLWEAGSLPAGRLVAAADALGAAGRAGDGQQILRQGVGRPPGEIGEAVLGLVAEGRHREVRVLLDAYVRARTPEEAARSAEPGPQTLVPLLLEAARGVSDERRRDLVHALRVAGYPA
ncbi:hypothetical protein QF034_006685 [Streptomyces africanus]|uniref:UL36 very large tegument protein n=1 Tax=Streptomyces africanus TaxID=231024 RepID=A0ABU0QYH1_9ACTN|nr:hypothetical protein [Streptomyces africanus]MDQ0752454.1 hypothetical protein [Streptomyces africanus]